MLMSRLGWSRDEEEEMSSRRRQRGRTMWRINSNWPATGTRRNIPPFVRVDSRRRKKNRVSFQQIEMLSHRYKMWKIKKKGATEKCWTLTKKKVWKSFGCNYNFDPRGSFSLTSSFGRYYPSCHRFASFFLWWISCEIWWSDQIGRCWS